MIDSLKSTDDIKNLRDSLKSEIGNNVVGLDKIIDSLVISILVGGHVLIEGFPGTGKTLIANLFSKSIESTANRIQSTSDLMPSDITGTRIYNPKEREFEFRSGPIFSNFVIVDEINRAPPKSQSALLECMQERQVSVEGMTRKMDEPFMVLATKNSIELEGTYPLPEAQLDRFLFRLIIDYPDQASESEIIKRRIGSSPEIAPVVSKKAILEGKNMIHSGINAEKNVLEYVSSLVQNTANIPKVTLGASPRASVALLYAAKGFAAVTEGRSYVIPDDVKAVAFDVLNHRLILQQNALLDLDDSDSNSATEYLRKIVKDCIDEVVVPV
ncbi:MAG: AAA family ATPase [Nitrososphaerales archaeon]|nr:AAA family ATPase [Nitrososphaerales archaeon]|tara:strand:- start:7075 stop:8058 length:984 start_codon:yes stop_codon:yes gene_type:complete